MLKRFKITSCAFILCLFGVTLTTVSPVLAEDSTAFQECQRIKPNGTSFALMKDKKDCFRDLARELSAANLAQEPLIEKSTDTASQLLAPNAEQEDLSVKVSELEGKIANMVKPELYDDAVRLYKEQQAQLTEANTKISDLEGKLANAVSPTVYDDAVRLYKEQQAQLTEANTKISDLEGKLANAVSPTVYDDAVRLYKEQQAQLTEANTKISDLEGKLANAALTQEAFLGCNKRMTEANMKISDLEGKLANAVLTEDAFKECDKRNNHNKATISILDENSEKLRQSGSCLKNKITDYASAIKVVPQTTPALESYRNDVVDELGIFIKSCE